MNIELMQCEFCGHVTEYDDIPTARDITGEIVRVCENCNEGESYRRYEPAKAIVQRATDEAKEADRRAD